MRAASAMDAGASKTQLTGVCPEQVELGGIVPRGRPAQRYCVFEGEGRHQGSG